MTGVSTPHVFAHCESGLICLTGVQTDEAALTVNEDMRSRNLGPRRDADIPHANITEERNSVRKVRGMTAGSRKGKESTMM